MVGSSRCDAKPNNLDSQDAFTAELMKKQSLISIFDPGILWDDFGIRYGVVVCPISTAFPAYETKNQSLVAFYP